MSPFTQRLRPDVAPFRMVRVVPPSESIPWCYDFSFPRFGSLKLAARNFVPDIPFTASVTRVAFCSAPFSPPRRRAVFLWSALPSLNG